MRSKVILVLAIILGLVTTLLFYNYMMQFDQEIITVNESLVEIVVAKKDIHKNQRITSDHLEKVSVSQTGVHAQTQTDLTEIIGKYAISNIAAGEQILSHRVSHEKEESELISRKIKEGYRAISVGVNFVQSVSNLIEPGDWVDVISTIKNTESEELESKLLLEKVYVLAVGRRMLESSPENLYVEYSASTLELKPLDAVKLANAAERGTIQLIVHSRILEREGMENAR
jgi:pilus assembly protein CpaB